jgi:hypothetical protein
LCGIRAEGSLCAIAIRDWTFSGKIDGPMGANKDHKEDDSDPQAFATLNEPLLRFGREV